MLPKVPAQLSAQGAASTAAKTASFSPKCPARASINDVFFHLPAMQVPYPEWE